MLPHYGEDILEGEEKEQIQVRYGKCNNCYAEMNHDNYTKNRKVCRICYNQNRSK